MTQAIPRIDNDLGFETAKQRITEMIDEIEQETDSSQKETNLLTTVSHILIS